MQLMDSSQHTGPAAPLLLPGPGGSECDSDKQQTMVFTNCLPVACVRILSYLKFKLAHRVQA